jgi:polysaccharide pyruvyl transferase WcaK-like protein
VPPLRPAAGRARVAAPRVGLFGLFGQGNLGNDGSLEAVLAYLRTRHPDAVLDIRCTRPEEVTARFGIPAGHLRWYALSQGNSGPIAMARKGLGTGMGLGIDAVRTARWVRRHDLVIVPGMGVLEATLPLRPWQTPYLMFLLCAFGRIFGTRVALVSVGSNVIRQRLTRMLVTHAARLAHYRSFRDTAARDAMRQMGLDTAGDAVYPDLAFSLPAPAGEAEIPGAVGVGLMDYSGGNDDRSRAADIHASYVEQMRRFVVWLLDSGRTVQLLAGDTIDWRVVQRVRSEVQALRPELAATSLTAEPACSLDELMRQMCAVETVVATRFHTVLCALMLGKPTLSVGYAPKFDALMAEMSLTEFAQSAKSVDAQRLIDQFADLEARAQQLRPAIIRRSTANTELLDRQFATLSSLLFPEACPGTAPGQPSSSAASR